MLLSLRRVTQAGWLHQDVLCEKVCLAPVGKNLREAAHADANGQSPCGPQIPASRSRGARSALSCSGSPGHFSMGETERSSTFAPELCADSPRSLARIAGISKMARVS